jgi:DNA-binding transcriptional MocR family regulator
MPKLQTSTQKIKQAARLASVAVLVMGGASQREIAEKLGVSLGTVNSDIKTLRKQWAESQKDVAYQFSLDLRRLDDLLGSIWAAASRGHIPAVDVSLKILDRRARMLGYDALDSELARQIQKRGNRGEVEELSDEALLQIAAGSNR